MRNHFQRISNRVAHLTVSIEVAGRLVLDKTSPVQRHQLGFEGRPSLFHLEQPFAPDEGWIVGPNPGGAIGLNEATDSEQVKNVREWLNEDAACYSNLGLLDVLPPGEYFLAQSPLKSRFADSIALGNEFVRATPNMRVLFDGDDVVRAAFIGPNIECSPDFRQPFLGVVICHASLTGHRHLVIFFQFDVPGPSEGIEPDPLLVIPATGYFVMDNRQLTTLSTVKYKPPPENNKHVEIWRKHLLTSFIAECSGDWNRESLQRIRSLLGLS